MADFTIKRGDTWPPLEATLQAESGPIDLTSATAVRLLLRSPHIRITAGEVDFADRPAGKVSYQWASGDTEHIGDYLGEFEIEWASGDIQTVPSVGQFTVSITADLTS